MHLSWDIVSQCLDEAVYQLHYFSVPVHYHFEYMQGNLSWNARLISFVRLFGSTLTASPKCLELNVK